MRVDYLEELQNGPERRRVSCGFEWGEDVELRRRWRRKEVKWREQGWRDRVDERRMMVLERNVMKVRNRKVRDDNAKHP